MPRITTVDISNHDEANEPAGYFTQHGTFEAHWPPKHRVSVSAPDGTAVVVPTSLPLPPKSAAKAEHVAYAVQELGVSQEDAEAMTVPELVSRARPDEEKEGEEPSAGTNSSTSGSKPAESGSSAQETEQSIHSPAPDAESPSAKGQATKPPRSSSVSSTATSTRGTGASRQSRSASSGESTDQTGPTQGPGDDPK